MSNFKVALEALISAHVNPQNMQEDIVAIMTQLEKKYFGMAVKYNAIAHVLYDRKQERGKIIFEKMLDDLKENCLKNYDSVFEKEASLVKKQVEKFYETRSHETLSSD